ncbi:hypothetical protein EVAR_85303_1 [Eumeta japonica]|uniref:BRICHOS domain-containing protein n=1 Tax=Eumeta variegata TaxID=151549 RepID=A0A4C1V6Z6_EUMVA|nr:hypothetical protein EVAR_85303_1 [Eumeta japonica]
MVCTNSTSIVEETRCFVMDMDPEFVLPPAMFVTSARSGGGEWDVSKVSTYMHAMLPPIRDLARYGSHIAQRCQDRVTYRLDADDKIIRKRSTDTPHLTQFSGRHIQELHVDNMAELLHYESQRAPSA